MGPVNFGPVRDAAAARLRCAGPIRSLSVGMDHVVGAGDAVMASRSYGKRDQTTAMA